jgi:hypothetical protein
MNHFASTLHRVMIIGEGKKTQNIGRSPLNLIKRKNKGKNRRQKRILRSLYIPFERLRAAVVVVMKYLVSILSSPFLFFLKKLLYGHKETKSPNIEYNFVIAHHHH